MGQEPSKNDAITEENHETRNNVTKNDQPSHSPVREVPRHHPQEEEVVDIEDVEDPHLDLIDLEYHANRRTVMEMDARGDTPDRELQRAATLPAKVERTSNLPPKDIEDSSYQVTSTAPVMNAMQTQESRTQNQPNAPTAPNSNDTKMAVADEEPAKTSVKPRFLLCGFLAGLLLGPFGFLLIIWNPARKRRGNVILVSIGVLMAILVWIVIIAISVGASL